MITVGVRAVRGYGRHGCLQWEKVTAQPFEIDVEVDLDSDRHAGLEGTLDYRILTGAATRAIAGPSRDLIEELAESVVHDVLAADARIVCCRIEVRKPQAAIGPSRGAYCRLERRR